MKLTLQIQLLPERDHAPTQGDGRAVQRGRQLAGGGRVRSKLGQQDLLQKLAYAELRERFGLSAQMAVRCIAQVCEAYKRDKTSGPSSASMPRCRSISG